MVCIWYLLTLSTLNVEEISYVPHSVVTTETPAHGYLYILLVHTCALLRISGKHGNHKSLETTKDRTNSAIQVLQFMICRNVRADIRFDQRVVCIYSWRHTRHNAVKWWSTKRYSSQHIPRLVKRDSIPPRYNYDGAKEIM